MIKKNRSEAVATLLARRAGFMKPLFFLTFPLICSRSWQRPANDPQASKAMINTLRYPFLHVFGRSPAKRDITPTVGMPSTATIVAGKGSRMDKGRWLTLKYITERHYSTFQEGRNNLRFTKCAMDIYQSMPAVIRHRLISSAIAVTMKASIFSVIKGAAP